MRFLSASAVAERIGIKTQTLAKWRRTGRGPSGWVYISQTLVCYPEEEIDRFLAHRAAIRPTFPTPPERPQAP